MVRNRKPFPTLAVGAVVLLAACQDVPVQPPTDLDAGRASLPPQAQAPDIDDLAARVPGLGGFFLDAAGQPTVYLRDVGARGAAEQALSGFLAARGRQLQVLRGDYEWRELRGWWDRATPEALAVPGAVFVDADEAANRVVIGVESAAAGAAVRSAVARAGIPDAAVVVREVEPIQFAATLRDQGRPVVGGLQIHFGNYLCTLGFNASDAGEASFITNSHCTNRQGGVEGTIYYQSLASQDGSRVAVEVEDPKYVKGGVCPKGRNCRYSDASRARYDAGASFTLGGIAQTSGPNNGSLTITGQFTIGGEDSRTSFTVGQTVNKVGRTTGWTQGSVLQTCVNTAVSGTNIVQLCQTFVGAGVGGGDSGSPVFTAGGSNATLIGILWGGNSSGTQFVFSPLAQIEQEIGALTTH